MKTLQFLVGKEVDIFNPHDTEEVDGLMASGKILGIQEGWIILANPKTGESDFVVNLAGDHYAKLSVALLWKRMLADRPQKPMLECTRARAAQDFENGYAESIAYHKRRKAGAARDADLRHAA